MHNAVLDGSRNVTPMLKAISDFQFLPARRYASAVFAAIACPSVRLSQVGVVPKRLNIDPANNAAW